MKCDLVPTEDEVCSLTAQTLCTAPLSLQIVQFELYSESSSRWLKRRDSSTLLCQLYKSLDRALSLGCWFAQGRDFIFRDPYELRILQIELLPREWS
uniref:Uncharacterized protein n=1 Tax=viral metagenome TaxID=1070528 RepID=A0A6C0JUD7_9ZZZZ